MDTIPTIRGVIPALLTPLADSGSIDENALCAHVEWLIEKGVHGLMPCGTTGEGPLLTMPERKHVVRIVTATVDGRVPVLAHVGAPTTRETIELARHAQECGAEAISVVTPYYFRLPDDALVEHFCRVAGEVTDTPVFLYNIPQNTGNALSREIVEAVVERSPNVTGIKDSGGDLRTLSSFVGLKDGSFQVVCGSDGLLLSALKTGACASVSGNANVCPGIVVNLFDAFWKGDQDTARRQQELLDQVREALRNGQSISLIKRALEFWGLRGGTVRPPLPEATPEMIADAKNRLLALELLS